MISFLPFLPNNLSKFGVWTSPTKIFNKVPSEMRNHAKARRYRSDYTKQKMNGSKTAKISEKKIKLYKKQKLAQKIGSESSRKDEIRYVSNKRPYILKQHWTLVKWNQKIKTKNVIRETPYFRQHGFMDQLGDTFMRVKWLQRWWHQII